MGDNRTAFSMGDSAHLNPPIWPPSFYSKLSPKPIGKNNSSRNFARMPSYSKITTLPNNRMAPFFVAARRAAAARANNLRRTATPTGGRRPAAANSTNDAMSMRIIPQNSSSASASTNSSASSSSSSGLPARYSTPPPRIEFHALE